MYSKSTIALVAALSTFAFAIPTALRAEDQSEWLNRQLQMTDGYAPPPALQPQYGDRVGASVSRGGVLRLSYPRRLPEQERHRATASPIRRAASRPGKVAPQPREVYQQPAAYEAPACEEAVARDEPPPSQAACADCTVIESPREADRHGEGSGLAAVIEPTREADTHGDGIGFAAVGALLVLAGFKVMKTLGAIQHA